VLGKNTKGRVIGEAKKILEGCGVLINNGDRLDVVRPAPKRSMPELPFWVWMAAEKGTPLSLSTLIEGDTQPSPGANSNTTL
jgi:hypothetical protein